MEAFAEATRILFRIIQTTHHLQNTAVPGGRTTSPASLQKKMQELATLVTPASQTDNTMDQDQYQREWPALRQTYPPGSPALTRNAERKHYTTRGTGQAVGSQDTTGSGNRYHCRNDP
ncbi:hypothetical protein SKAU_G00128280 [Synaphobranchus kaupii]|uniref:Uncharacterized protein n=1 Tax=Synaphobranchus kaupii TaxID=118154 RepID=A0A9Q1FQ14_SYNKA|nr:hypothetical protein SKAU_G00158960 [Synaphobranchus kaupii]KAJ8363997.1 hypothetical protein SKAU_G00128280 [Synaphobranchus kaupii]